MLFTTRCRLALTAGRSMCLSENADVAVADSSLLATPCVHVCSDTAPFIIYFFTHLVYLPCHSPSLVCLLSSLSLTRSSRSPEILDNPSLTAVVLSRTFQHDTRDYNDQGFCSRVCRHHDHSCCQIQPARTHSLCSRRAHPGRASSCFIISIVQYHTNILI